MSIPSILSIQSIMLNFINLCWFWQFCSCRRFHCFLSKITILLTVSIFRIISNDQNASCNLHIWGWSFSNENVLLHQNCWKLRAPSVVPDCSSVSLGVYMVAGRTRDIWRWEFDSPFRGPNMYHIEKNIKERDLWLADFQSIFGQFSV